MSNGKLIGLEDYPVQVFWLKVKQPRYYKIWDNYFKPCRCFVSLQCSYYTLKQPPGLMIKLVSLFFSFWLNQNNSWNIYTIWFQVWLKLRWSVAIWRERTSCWTSGQAPKTWTRWRDYKTATNSVSQHHTQQPARCMRKRLIRAHRARKNAWKLIQLLVNQLDLLLYLHKGSSITFCFLHRLQMFHRVIRILFSTVFLNIFFTI